MPVIPSDEGERAMNDPTPPGPSTPSMPSMPEAVFRTITPVFKQTIEGATEFNHSGQNRDAHFRIELRPYSNNPEDFAYITRYAKDGVRQMLRERAIHLSDHFFSHAEYFLVADLEYPAGIVAAYAGGTQECQEVLLATLEALRLHSSSGLTFHESYRFRSNSSAHGGLGINVANALQNRFPHLPSPSVLRASDFEAGRATIDMFLARKWSDQIALDNVLQL